MFRLGYLLVLIFFVVFGVYKYNIDSKDDDFKLPEPDKVVTLLSVQESSGEKSDFKLPDASRVKKVESSSVQVSAEDKSKSTSFTYPSSYKSQLRRLSKEEIQEAPIVARFIMNVNGKDAEVIVVEKDGMTYDASDGIRIYMPESLKLKSRLLDFLYN